MSLIHFCGQEVSIPLEAYERILCRDWYFKIRLFICPFSCMEMQKRNQIAVLLLSEMCLSVFVLQICLCVHLDNSV